MILQFPYGRYEQKNVPVWKHHIPQSKNLPTLLKLRFFLRQFWKIKSPFLCPYLPYNGSVVANK